MSPLPPPSPPPPPIARAGRDRRRPLGWLLLVAFLAVPPLIWPQSWLLAYLAQSASLIVFALSYNLLLGETGLLSFGHAIHAGLGALIAAQVFNRTGAPLALLPLVGGLGGALTALPLGFVATRRAGTAFAMITLGLGELVVAAAWALPDWFGGAAGVAIDRGSGVPLVGWSYASDGQAYALIALWCVAASAALGALSRTPFMRLANAVRDNPVRAAAIGCEPRRVRFGVMLCAAFFAGIAGTLGLIELELVAPESVGVARSGAVLIATVIGGSATFFGPVLGAIVLSFFSVALASVTRAWPFYLGLLFVTVVSVAPDGLAGFAGRQRARIAELGWRQCRPMLGWSALALLLWSAAVVVAVQWAYAASFGVDDAAGASGAVSEAGLWANVRAIFGAVFGVGSAANSAADSAAHPAANSAANPAANPAADSAVLSGAHFGSTLDAIDVATLASSPLALAATLLALAAGGAFAAHRARRARARLSTPTDKAASR